MGITGLLPLLKKASSNCNVRKFSGCTVAIDAYSWLHKGAFGCAEKLGKGEPTTAYISYCMKYIQILLDNKVKPILVLDGRNLPSKEVTEKKRRAKRDENRRLARKYLQEGRKKEAWECFTRCVDITPAMAREFIKVLRSMKIDYVVAPYEADAQLAYLAVTGIADIIITEDSDLVLFGCPKIFFKMNVNGDGTLFDSAKLPQCFGLTASNFNFDLFRWMCILSGCDYLQSLPGIGLGRAKKVMLGANHESIEAMIRSIPSLLDKVSVDITDDYIDAFIQADNTFLYQLVFDTVKRKLRPLIPYPDEVDPEDFPYAGSYQYENLANELALGNIDLHSLKVVDNFDPLKSGYTNTSIWSPNFNPSGYRSLVTKPETTKVAMELSTIKKSSPKKKRPFADISMANDTTPGDAELMNIYGEVITSTTERNVIQTTDFKQKSQGEVTDSPSRNKRRRVAEENNEEQLCSPSSNTRSHKRNVLFRKSSEKIREHVKSKYFKTEKIETSLDSKKNLLIEKTESDSSSSEVEDNLIETCSSNYSSSQTKLNIYSYDSSSQECKSDQNPESPSQAQIELINAQESHISTDEIEKFALKTCTVSVEKISNSTLSIYSPATATAKKVEEITLEDDEDEAYGSASSSGSNGYSLRSTPSLSTLTLTSAASTSSPYFSCNATSNVKPAITRSSTKTATPCRRIGLSRTKGLKKDPKQPSIKEMFVRKL